MRFKNARQHKRAGRKVKGHTVTFRLDDEQWAILRRLSDDSGSSSVSAFSKLVFLSVLYELEMTARGQEDEFGVRFADPVDCDCCGGKIH